MCACICVPSYRCVSNCMGEPNSANVERRIQQQLIPVSYVRHDYTTKTRRIHTAHRQKYIYIVFVDAYNFMICDSEACKCHVYSQTFTFTQMHSNSYVHDHTYHKCTHDHIESKYSVMQIGFVRKHTHTHNTNTLRKNTFAYFRILHAYTKKTCVFVLFQPHKRFFT